MTKLEALQGSVDKWEAICDDKCPVLTATGCCSLCDYDASKNTEMDCIDCPLTNVGEQCGNLDSAWFAIRKRINKYWSGPIVTLSQKEDPILTDLCHKMRDTLRGLLEEEQTLLEKK